MQFLDKEVLKDFSTYLRTKIKKDVEKLIKNRIGDVDFDSLATETYVDEHMDEVVETLNNTVSFNKKILTLPDNRGAWRVIYADGKFVAIDGSPSYGVSYSEDGINWTRVDIVNSSIPLSGIAYGNGKFVIVCRGTNTAFYSTDAITWTRTTMPTSSSWSSVAYGNGKFVAVSETAKVLAYSEDGVVWTQTTVSSMGTWVQVVYGNDKFVAISSSSNYSAIYSADGINWTIGSSSSSGKSWRSLTYGNGVFLGLAFEYGYSVYSTDGINWSKKALPSSGTWEVTYGDGKFIAVPVYPEGKLMYSTDGINWTETEFVDRHVQYYNSVAYGNNKFVAVGAGTTSTDSEVAVSTDGINWTNSIEYLSNFEGNDITDKVKSLVVKTPDWNQNDSSAPDYIKNRTHWVENEELQTLYSNNSFTFNKIGTSYEYDFVSSIPFVVGKKYTIIFDGVEYKCIAKPTGEEGGIECVVDTGSKSFAIEAWDDVNTWIYTSDSSVAGANHSLVIQAGGETFYQLDERFIPDSVATKADLLNAGGAKVITGTYTGNGNASKTYTFDSKVLAIAVQRTASYNHPYHVRLAYRGMPMSSPSWVNSTNVYVNLTWGDNAVTITRVADEYGNDTIYNFNASGNTYAYLAIIE